MKMEWIKINKNTLKSFIRKNNIEDIKINLNTKWNGMIDGTETVDINKIISVKEFLDEINSNIYGIHLYLTEKGFYAYSSYISYSITDERFEKFKEEILIKNIAGRL